MADRDIEWDPEAAEKRVRAWADANRGPNEKYRDAHLWYDRAQKDDFTAYKLLIADVVDGRVRAVPDGVLEACETVLCTVDGTDLPPEDLDRVKHHLTKYFEKMDEPAPWACCC